MPLTRYEIRNEYRLANPDLYRATAKDDPHGLLEGVAMAGLVGIVRQVGDLAEFAAEVFHDLHEEVLATAARGHELLIRVQQLEAELPVVEKMMFTEITYVNFAYNPGVEWHAGICNDQNHFTRGDLPRFVRTAYENCRGPPRLSELDKFDVAGDGACLKRYTDPSFFKMEWASSELMKAEKEKQERKARRIKKKGRGHMRETIFTNVHPRLRHTPLEIENLGSTSGQSPFLKSHHGYKQENLGLPLHEQGLSVRVMIPEDEVFEHEEGSLRVQLPEQERSDVEARVKLPSQDCKPLDVAQQSSDLNHESSKDRTDIISTANSSSDVVAQKRGFCIGVEAPEDLADKLASEADNFADALTTMDSEVETDVEIKTVVDENREFGSDARVENATLQVQGREFNCLGNSVEEGLVTEHDIPSGCEKPDISGRADMVHANSSPWTSPAEENQPSFLDGSYASPSVEETSGSTPVNKSATGSPAFMPSVAVNSRESMESESFDEVPETPEILQTKDPDDGCLEEGAFHQLPELAMSLAIGSPQDGSPDNFALLSCRTGAKSAVLLNKWSLAEENSFEDAESELEEGLRGSSPHSSANSSIQPMSWARDISNAPTNLLDSDDELDGMQVSSSCPSSTSSALSSPRPFSLATTVFNTDLEKEPRSLFSPQGSIQSSPESLLNTPPKDVENDPQSARIIMSSSTLPLLKTAAMASVMSPPPVNSSSNLTTSSLLSSVDNLPDLELKCQAPSATEQSQGLETDEFEPPPPPLPPVEWRMTRRSNAIPPAPRSFLKRPFDGSGAPTTSTLRSFAPESICLQPNGSIQALKSYPTRDHNSQDPLSELQQSVRTPPATHRESVIFENAQKDSSSLPGEPADQLVHPLKAYSLGFPTQPSSLVFPDDLVESSPPEIRKHSTSQVLPLKINKAPQMFRGATAKDDEEGEESSHAGFSQLNSHLQEQSPCFSPSESQGRNPTLVVSNKIPADRKYEVWDDGLSSPPARQNLPSYSEDKEEEKNLSGSTKSIPSPGPEPDSIELSRPSFSSKVGRRDPLIAAISSYDRGTPRTVPELSQYSRTVRLDDREVLLEQIRTGSFSLRQTKVEKQEAPRPITSINVAAILEKANAIRQAFAGSDDEEEGDDWSD